MTLDQLLQPALQEREAASLYRRRRVIESTQGPEVVVEGKSYLGFCSNDYLGLAADPRISKAFIAGVEKFGNGSGASHLVLGHSSAHHQLEDALAELTGRDRVLLFSTGYMANLGALSALVDRGDLVLEDRLNHASLLDGGLLSGAKFKRFQHADVASAEQQLTTDDSARRILVTDGVFSMDGDIAPLPELAELCQNQHAHLVVDDAHGFGCLGAKGAGCVEQFGLSQQQVPVLIGTLGKAAGTAGAFVAGSETLIEYLIQFARPYIYTTAMPPAVAAATLESLKIIESEIWRREHLKSLITRFREGVSALGYNLMDSDTAIQPIQIGESALAMSLSRALEGEGLFVGAIRPPTVPQGTARLRITLSAAHTEAQVDRLLAALEKHRGLLDGLDTQKQQGSASV